MSLSLDYSTSVALRTAPDAQTTYVLSNKDYGVCVRSTGCMRIMCALDDLNPLSNDFIEAQQVVALVISLRSIRELINTSFSSPLPVVYGGRASIH